MLYKDVTLFSITEHLMKFNTKKNQLILNIKLLYDQDSFYFFVNSLTLYLHLTSTKNLWDLAGTRGIKTKNKVSMKKGSVQEEFITYILH